VARLLRKSDLELCATFKESFKAQEPDPMNSSIDLTTSEHSALSKAIKLLGDSLAPFLLSGLGQSSITNRRSFTAQSTPNHHQDSQALAYRFEMLNDSSLGLPMGRDPLVMALLLNILRDEMRMADTIDFNVSHILKSLGWPQTTESHLLIQRAIERYASTFYCLTELNESEESGTRFQRLLIGYETIFKPLIVEEATRQLWMKVKFFPSFIYGIFPERKSFLGVEFQQLQQMREIPVEGAQG
jgi:hypothetical protein